MKDIVFWHNWKAEHKSILYILTAVAALALVFFAVYFSLGLDNLVDWDVKQEVEKIPVLMDSFNKNLLEYTLNIDNYIVRNTPISKGLGIRVYESGLYLAFLGVSIVILLTALSGIKKVLWFALSMTFFIAYLAFLDLGELGGGLITIANYEISITLILVLVLYLVPAIYFNMFAEHRSVLQRISIFTLATLIAGMYIIYTSGYNYSHLYITNKGILLPVIVATIFIMMISYDVIGLIASIVSYSKATSGSTSVLNFVIGSLLYLVNLLLLFLNQQEVIDWEIYYFNPLWLLVLSIIAGFWGHKRRSEMFAGTIGFKPFGALLYLGLTVLVLSTLGYTYATVNTPLIDYFEQVIVVTHLSFGFLFFIYVMFNFMDALKEASLPIYRVFYKPIHMQYKFVRLTALAFIVFLLVKSQFHISHRVVSSVNNLEGDFRFMQGQFFQARLNYIEAAKYTAADLKSNYYLAQLYLLDDQKQRARDHINRIMDNAPAPFLYLRMASIYEKDESEGYKDIFALQEGLRKFPDDYRLNFSLGAKYENYAVYDSAQFYYHKAALYTEDVKDIYTNLLHTYVLGNLVDVAEKQMMEFEDYDDVAFQANKFAAFNALNKKYDKEINKSFFEEDSTLNSLNGAYANNLILNEIYAENPETEKLDYVITKDPGNLNYEQWTFFRGLLAAYDYNLNEGKEAFDELLGNIPLNFYPYYSNNAATAMYKNGGDEFAQDYWQKSRNTQQYYTLDNAPVYAAIFTLPNLEREGALSLLDNLVSRKSEFKAFVNVVRPVFEIPVNAMDSLSDEQLYYALTLNKDVRNSSLVVPLINAIDSDVIRNASIIQLMHRFINDYKLAEAEEVWKQIGGNATPEQVRSLNFEYLRFLDATEKYEELQAEVQQVDLLPEHERWKTYFMAKTQFENGEVARAAKHMDHLQTEFKYDEKVQVLISDILKESGDLDQAYDVVVAGLERNPESVALNKQYAVLAVELGLTHYVNGVLNNLKSLMGQDEYQEFEARVLRRIEETEQEMFEQYNAE